MYNAKIPVDGAGGLMSMRNFFMLRRLCKREQTEYNSTSVTAYSLVWYSVLRQHKHDLQTIQ